MRSDEMEVPVRLGDAPPFLPFRKPFDLNAWQLPLLVLTGVLTLNLDGVLPLSDEPFQPDTLVSPMIAARFTVLALGLMIIFIQPGRRLLPVWIWIALKHFWQTLPAVYGEDDDERGPRYFPADAAAMSRMKLEGSSAIFVVDPPLWSLMRHLPGSDNWWQRHNPYRLTLPVEAQGSLELMTDDERCARWQALAQGLRALRYPVQFVSQARSEDSAWLADVAMPPLGSPFVAMRRHLREWASHKAGELMYRRVVVTCSAATAVDLIEHVRDVVNALGESGLQVRETTISEQRNVFEQVYGARKFFPHPVDKFGIDGTSWVTLVVLDFPRHCVVGWLMFIIRSLPVDVGLYAEPDDAGWVTRVMEMFQGMCDLPTADTAHQDARADLERVEGKLKRNEDCVMRTTLLLTMPERYVARVSNRLRKAGATFRTARFEHQAGRMATLPAGGSPAVGHTRPLDGASVAGCYPLGSAGLRMPRGILLGTARTAPEAVTLDLRDPALNSSMVCILGTTGAGKTVLMEMLLLRSGLPFVVIDMKPHLSETKHGDFYPLVAAAGGSYYVCQAGQPLPAPHPFAQAYNLAAVDDRDKPAVLQAIAEQEWTRAVDSLEDRIFAMDEGYWLGRTAAGQEFIERIVSQGRSVGFIGICASQEVSDFLSERRLAKAVTMSSIQFVLAQEFGQVDNVARALGLGGDAANELRKFQPNPGDDGPPTRSAIMRVGRRMVSFRIETCPEEMRLYTTKPADRRAARELVESGLAA